MLLNSLTKLSLHFNLVVNGNYKMCNILKRLPLEQKRLNVGGKVYIAYFRLKLTFDLNFEVILRTFGAFPIFDNLVSRKWLVVQ